MFHWPLMIMIIMGFVFRRENLFQFVFFVIYINFSKIPVLNKMSGHIFYRFSNYHHLYVMPGHSGLCNSIYLGNIMYFYICEIFYSNITIVYAWKIVHFFSFFILSRIFKRMLLGIISSITQIKTPHESITLINYDYFFMMGPQERKNCCRMP